MLQSMAYIEKQRKVVVDLNIPDPNGYLTLVYKLDELKDGEYFVEITKKTKKASPKQRGYYHGILVIAIAVHLGWEKEDVEEHMKSTYNRVTKTNPITGNEIEIPGSTAGFDTKRYTELIDQVRNQFIPQFCPGLEVPEPKWITQEYVVKLREAYKNRYHT